MKGFLLLIFLLLSVTAHASLDMASLARVPIVHDGRIKPLDTFARMQLRLIYGRESLPDKSAMEWLAMTLFTPTLAAEYPIFRLQHRSLIDLLEVEPRTPPVYSFQELLTGIEKTAPAIPDLLRHAETLNERQRALLALHDAVQGFLQISYAFAPVLPMPLLLEGYDNPAPQTYLDWQKHREAIEREAETRLTQDMEALESESIALLHLWAHLRALEEKGRQNVVLRLMPPQWQGQREWLSPWQLLLQGAAAPAHGVYYQRLYEASMAYMAGDALQWRNASASLLATAVHLSETVATPWRLSLEKAYHRYAPLEIAALLYGLALVLWGLSLYQPISLKMLVSVLGLGVTMHTVAIVMRVLILARPPVSTLYESLLFVGWLSALIGLWYAFAHRHPIGIAMGAASGGFLLMASYAFTGTGDTMDVLIAVLNTHFWLALHVLVITAGYALCLITALLAHYALATNLEAWVRSLRVFALASLLFTTLGTILGGIWADQSWGRFWGWDPKENGALLIVLWLVWLLHGRIAGQINTLFFTAGMALLSIIVALSWVGVNMLGVGLHSYGFTNAAATGLFLFCAVEVMIIAALTTYAARKMKTV